MANCVKIAETTSTMNKVKPKFQHKGILQYFTLKLESISQLKWQCWKKADRVLLLVNTPLIIQGVLQNIIDQCQKILWCTTVLLCFSKIYKSRFFRFFGYFLWFFRRSWKLTTPARKDLGHHIFCNFFKACLRSS